MGDLHIIIFFSDKTSACLFKHQLFALFRVSMEALTSEIKQVSDKLSSITEQMKEADDLFQAQMETFLKVN